MGLVFVYCIDTAVLQDCLASFSRPYRGSRAYCTLDDPMISLGSLCPLVQHNFSIGGTDFPWPLGQGTIQHAHRGPHSNFFSELVHVAGVFAKKRGGRGNTSHGSGGRRRMVSPTWLEASLCNVSLHVFWQHGRTLGVCEVQPCEGRFFFSFRWHETGGLCFRRAGNEDACCI